MIRNQRVAVLGAGIGGLAAAYHLSGYGIRPVVFESSAQLGGLGTAIDHQGVALDRFYHVLLESDRELLALINELELSERLHWTSTGMGFHIGGRLYGLNTPLDVLRFGALPFAERLRMALGALRATRRRRNPLQLDDIPAHDWLHRLFGHEVATRIWEPLLRAKFGDAADSIPAYWLWSLLSREKNGGPEVKGYLRGGFQTLANELRSAIVRRGGEVRLGAAVTRLERASESLVLRVGSEIFCFDSVLSTLPLPQLRQLAAPSISGSLPLVQLRYQGVVNAVVVTRRALERFYWTIVVDPRCAFQGVVETTHVIPPEWLGGRHLIYLMNYCDRDSDLYQRPDEVVREQALAGLEMLYPTFAREQVETVYVFRAPYVEPVWSLGYSRQRPPVRAATPGLYLATTAQAYPRVTAWNTSIGLAHDAVQAIVEDSVHRVQSNSDSSRSVDYAAA